VRVAALVLGIVGGVLGLLSAVFALGIGGIGSVAGTQGAGTVIGLGWSAMGFAFLGFLGAGLAMGKPRLGGTLLLIAGIGFLISISFAVLATPLFLIAALMAFMGRRDTKATI
jgi:hypothetical protein